MRKNLVAVAAGGALAFALAGAVSPTVAWGSAYPAGVAAGTVLAATNGDIHVNGATASSDPDDGGQLPAATNGDIRVNTVTASSDPDDGGQLPAATVGNVHVGNGG